MCDVLALYFRREYQDYQGSRYCIVQHSNFVLLNSVDSLTFSVKVIAVDTCRSVKWEKTILYGLLVCRFLTNAAVLEK